MAPKRKMRTRLMVWSVIERLQVAGAAGVEGAGLEDGV